MGVNCFIVCLCGFYGNECGEYCNCFEEFCNVIFGCIEGDGLYCYLIRIYCRNFEILKIIVFM